MIKLFRKMSKYMTAMFTGKFDELADPKIQLEQAIIEAQDQHRRLTEQAANVIASQKQTEMNLNRSMAELETTSGRARQALLMADDAAKKGDATRAAELEKTAEILANKLIQVEREVESLKQMHLQTSENANNAKQAVKSNSAALQKKLNERQKLLSQIDQTKMQEQMNRAMTSLSATVGQDVPTLDEVRQKIETRYAKALGSAELHGDSVETRMLEVEQVSADMEAQARLAELRTQLGLSSPTAGAGEVGTGTVSEQMPQAAPSTTEVPRKP